MCSCIVFPCISSQPSFSLGGMSFYEDGDGNKYVVGADSVPKKLGNNVSQMTTLINGNTDSTSKVTLGSYTFATKPNRLTILNWHTGGNIGYLSYKINNSNEISLGGQSGSNVQASFIDDVINANDLITLYGYVNNIVGRFMVQLVDFK